METENFITMFIFCVFLCLCNYYIILYYGVPPAWGLGMGLTSPHSKKLACYEMLHRASELAGSCEHGNKPSDSIKGGEFLD
jgi:hypothetical protein